MNRRLVPLAVLPLALAARSAGTPAPPGGETISAAGRNAAPDPAGPADRPLAGKRARIFLAEERREPALALPLLNDPDEWLRARAARAIGRIGAPYAALRLAPLLNDPGELARAGAAWGALYLGAAARPLLPRLRELAKNPGAPRLPALECVIALNEEADAGWIVQSLSNEPALQNPLAGHLFRMDRPAVREALKGWARSAAGIAAPGALSSLIRLKLEDEPFYRELAAASTGEKKMLAVRGLGFSKNLSPESRALVEAAAKDGAEPLARSEAIGLLVKFRGPAAEPVLAALADARARDDAQTVLRIYDAIPDGACDAAPTLAALASELSTPADSERTEPPLVPRDPRPAVLRRLVAKAAGCAKPQGFATDGAALLRALNGRRREFVRVRIALAEALAARPELPGDLLKELAADPDPLVRSAAGSALITRGQDPAPWLLNEDLGIVEAAAGTAAEPGKERKAPRLTGKLLARAYGRIAKRPDGGSARLYLARAAAACAAKDAAGKKLLVRAIAKDRDRAVQLDAWGRWPPSLAGRPEWPQPNLPPPDFADAERRLGTLVAATPRFAVETTRGTFTMAFDARGESPGNVLNFRRLVERKYFDRIAWHRVVPDFVVQGGDPRGDGSGGPGWMVPCEYNSFPYAAGTVGMALDGKDTGGSQFFIALTRVPHLDYRYTVLGRVESGMDVVYKLGEDDKIVSIREITR